MTRTQRIAQVRQRRSQRGAALVEAAFMFPMLIICFYACVYMHTFYSSQIDDNTLARESAWNDTMKNCADGPGDSVDQDTPAAVPLPTPSTRSTFVGIGASSNSIPAPTSSVVDTNKLDQTSTTSDVGSQISSAFTGGSFTGVIGGLASAITGKLASIFPNPNGAEATTTTSFSWRSINQYATNDSGTLQKRTTGQYVTVMCNEKPQNGSPAAVFKDIASGISSAVSGMFSH